MIYADISSLAEYEVLEKITYRSQDAKTFVDLSKTAQEVKCTSSFGWDAYALLS